MNKDSKIFVAGHNGLVGSAIVRKLQVEGYHNVITRTRKELNLIDKAQVDVFFEEERPEYVFLAAAKVGGVHANNTLRAEFIYENLAIQTNVIHACYVNRVKKLLFLGSNCLYPNLVQRPIKEEYLLAGKIEPTTEAYAIAKIAGIKMCEAYREQYGCNFITLLPVNIYGPNDSYDLENSHVMPGLLRKFKEAVFKGSEYVEIFGTGNPRREFMHVDDLADACLFCMLNYNEKEPINIGTNEEISINDLTRLLKEITGFKGNIKNDLNKPDGVMSKMLDITKLQNIGWKHKISLREGVTKVYSDLKDITL